MNLKTQFTIKNNPYLARYLHENSHWFKMLNRNPSMLLSLEKEMKERYKLTTKDKMEDLSRKIDFIQNFMNLLN